MRLKSQPEDFIVDEIQNFTFFSTGKYSYYLLKKINLETQAAIQKISDMFKINPNHINFAGTKDKTAVTTQYISIQDGPERDITTDNCIVQYLGKRNERLNLGMLQGNMFTITVRDVTPAEKKKFATKQFINYYDDQRFGNRKNTHSIGKYLVKKDFKAAALEAQSEHYPYILVTKHLEKHPADYVGALRQLPRKLLLMFIHAYQSYLWNETVKAYLKKKKHTTIQYSLGELFVPTSKIKDVEIPLISFDIEAHAQMQKILDAIMKKEQITERDFIIKQIPELIASGGTRSLLITCKDFTSSWIDAKTVVLKFSLSKGSYATMVVKELFCSLHSNKDIDQSKKKEKIFHKSRRMFCVYNNALVIAQANVPYSHADWFEKKGWISRKKQDLMTAIVRGFIDKKGDVYFYMGHDFEINEKTETIFFSHLKELVKKLKLKPQAKVFGGLIKQEVGKIWPPQKKYGTIQEILD